MRKIFVLVFLTALACNKEKEEKQFRCVEYTQSIKPFCLDVSKLSDDIRIRETQLRICADENLRKLDVCVRWER